MLLGFVHPLKETEALFAPDIKAESECGGLLQSQLEGKLCIMHLCGRKSIRGLRLLTLLTASIPLPQSPLCVTAAMRSGWQERRGEIHIEEITLLLDYATVLAAPVSEQHHLSRGDWVFFASVSGRDRDQERESHKRKREKERGKEAERASVQLSGVPSSTKLLQLPSSTSSSSWWDRERECNRERNSKREREQQRESERVTLTSQRRRDVKRRIYTREKKIPSLSSAPSLRASYGQWGVRRIRLAFFFLRCFPVISEAVQHWVERRESRRELAPWQRSAAEEEGRRGAGMLNNLTDTEEGDGGAQSQGEWWDVSCSRTLIHTDMHTLWHNNAGHTDTVCLPTQKQKEGE